MSKILWRVGVNKNECYPYQKKNIVNGLHFPIIIFLYIFVNILNQTLLRLMLWEGNHHFHLNNLKLCMSVYKLKIVIDSTRLYQKYNI